MDPGDSWRFWDDGHHNEGLRTRDLEMIFFALSCSRGQSNQLVGDGQFQ